MPFRCTDCQFLSATESNDACENKPSCNFERVEVVHYLTTDVRGKVVGRKEVRTPTGSELVPVYLGCDTTKSQPTASAHYPAVTCLACRENYPPQERPSESSEEQSSSFQK